MRRATLLTLLLFILSIGGVCFAASDIYKAHDQVKLTETTIYGDKTAAEGVNVQLGSTYDHRLFWDTSYTISDASTPETKYHFSSTHLLEDYDLRSGVSFDTSVYSYDFIPEAEEQTGVYVALKELFDSIDSGVAEKTIHLKDYMDYYPLMISVDFGEYSISTDTVFWNLDEYMEIREKNNLDALFQLQEYFKIPVIEEETYNIHLEKYDDNILSYGCSTGEGDRFYMNMYNAVTDDVCYFAFDAHTENGKLVDLSELTHGYGIYRLPYEYGREDKAGNPLGDIIVEEFEMIYPLSPEAKLVELDLDKEQKKLLLHTIENGQQIMTVIDIETRTPIQELVIPLEIPDDARLYPYNCEDFLVLASSYIQKLAVIDINENGKYELEFSCDFAVEDFEMHPQDETAIAFDGERLAIACILRDEEFYGIRTCNLGISVYDSTGLLYYGEHKNTLDTGRDIDTYEYRCTALDWKPIQLEWN